jgi:hypothetical protein
MSTTDTSITVALIQVIAAISCAVLVAIQGYRLNRIEQEKLKVEKFSRIGEKCDLEIRPVIQADTNELVNISNKGTMSIDELTVKMDLTVKRRKESDLYLSVKWSTNALLSPKETTTIPLHEKLWPFFEQNHLAKLVEERTGPDPEDIMYTASLEKQLSIMLDIQVSMTVQKEISTMRKKYSLNYSWRSEPPEWFEDDYVISTSQYMGEWVK